MLNIYMSLCDVIAPVVSFNYSISYMVYAPFLWLQILKLLLLKHCNFLTRCMILSCDTFLRNVQCKCTQFLY